MGNQVDKNSDMTKNAGMEEFYDKMGAITPEEAAKPLADFAEKLDLSMSGKFWAPREFLASQRRKALNFSSWR